ncbi:MAG TPA: NADH-quinone oxidoreductase subunit C [Vicinamibacterales bacterium]|nr:NADH-quinone oxidoreductase subunit C [Vicinamibacterales bacterium]
MNARELQQHIARRWPARGRLATADATLCLVEPDPDLFVDLCGWLFRDLAFAFAGTVVEEGDAEWTLRHLFYDTSGGCWVHVIARRPLADQRFPSIIEHVYAADWHEREAEDMFGLVFEGHPRLGDFILHDDAWQEGVEPMRHRFSAQTPVTDRRPRSDVRPHRIVHESGAFVMPVGPVFAALAEPVHFQLETVGEDVIRAFPRLSYKYRGIEKIAEGRPSGDGLLLAERFAATTAFAHALGFCHAVEAIGGVDVPLRARLLRLFVAELERFRHHVGAIAGICESTALVVAASQAAILEEELLRVSGALTGHRYLFGLATPGGLTVDLSDAACERALQRCRDVLTRTDRLEERLRTSSSFLDRLEEVGGISQEDARAFGLVGPIARASGIAGDLRRTQPYGEYPHVGFEVPIEAEGDGYARLRILHAEARQAVRLMEQIVRSLRSGPVSAPVPRRAGAALGWVEAPRGASFHWVRLAADGTVARYRLVPPSFTNWHGFRLSVENFAFQDFPIILATLDLSVAENDR